MEVQVLLSAPKKNGFKLKDLKPFSVFGAYHQSQKAINPVPSNTSSNSPYPFAPSSMLSALPIATAVSFFA
ncbi:MAG: hypothetical protein GXX99_03820 [Clostridiales bacterium]|nr:hypothetical protein [Clostridiales bacterium]